MQNAHKSMLDLEKNKGGEKKKYSGRKKMRLLILWKTSKAKSHFCVLLFTFPVIPPPAPAFPRVREQERRVTENIQTMKNIQELGKLSGGTRKARILNKRKAFVICQKFLYSLCLPTEWPALFGGPSLSRQAFTLNWGARKVLSTWHHYCCYPWKCRAPGLPAAKVPGFRAVDLRPRRPSQLLLGKPCPPQLWRGKSPG